MCTAGQKREQERVKKPEAQICDKTRDEHFGAGEFDAKRRAHTTQLWQHNETNNVNLLTNSVDAKSANEKAKNGLKMGKHKNGKKTKSWMGNGILVC